MDAENQNDVNPLVSQIQEFESKIQDTERDLALLKRELEVLRQRHADSIVIDWRDEIMKCLMGVDDQPIFTSYAVILNSIETKYHLVASGKTKSSIITTLSLMFKEGIIGRTEVSDIHYYGIKKLFSSNDLTVVKDEFLTLFDKCRAFVGNFEREP